MTLGRSALFDRSFLAAVLIVLCLVGGVVVLGGGLHAGPRLVDDNQIFGLDRQVQAEGFSAAVEAQWRTRARSGRYVLVFLTEKVLKSWLYGSDVVLWRLHVMGLAILAGLLLHLAATRLGFRWPEALLFALLTITGAQSITWTRLIHGEGLGLVFLALALWIASHRIGVGRRAMLLDAAFVACLVLAGLTKESFLLVLPAMVLWRLVMVSEERSQSLRATVRERWPLLVPLLAVSAVYAANAPTLRQSFETWYVGSHGLGGGRLRAAIADLFAALNPWPLVLAAAVLLVASAASRSPPAALRPVARRLLLVATVAAGIVVPQVVLYGSVGFGDGGNADLDAARYLIPASLGFALLFVAFARATREVLAARPGRPPAFARAVTSLSLVIGGAFVAVQAHRALETTSLFVARAASETELLRFVGYNTEKGEAVVVVCAAARPANCRRFGNLFTGHYAQRKIYRYPVGPPQRPARARSDERLRRALAADLRAKRVPLGAIVFEGRQQRAFERERPKWFRPHAFDGYRNDRGWVVLVPRCGPRSGPRGVQLATRDVP